MTNHNTESEVIKMDNSEEIEFEILAEQIAAGTATHVDGKPRETDHLTKLFAKAFLDEKRRVRTERARADKAETELARVSEVTELLIEAAQQQIDYMDICNDKGDLERNLRRAVALARAVGEEG